MESMTEYRQSSQYIIGGLYMQLAQTRYDLEQLQSERAALNLDQVEQLTRDYAFAQDRVIELERKLAQCLESTAGDSAKAKEASMLKVELEKSHSTIDELNKSIRSLEKDGQRLEREAEGLRQEVSKLEAARAAEELEAQKLQSDETGGESSDEAVVAERDKLRKTVERLRACVTTSAGHLRRAAKHWDNEDDDKAYNAAASALKLLNKNTTKDSEN
ncbi:hypothetical protein [Corynebacterium aurimucosum]|uniref:hypothetical protein n=1 Tax=Corynebacterium aurimucosum TaxID=169292 RepID=UPI00187AE1CD|nr:hypothetical protein [Corynebacterium aurimucosum]MBE7338101.1 hypothetical protein [Corynebacterium aurimucosum]